jgi:hypothetical protein
MILLDLKAKTTNGGCPHRLKVQVTANLHFKMKPRMNQALEGAAYFHYSMMNLYTLTHISLTHYFHVVKLMRSLIEFDATNNYDFRLFLTKDLVFLFSGVCY